MLRKVMLLVSAVLVLLVVNVYAGTDELDYINAAIHAKGGKWIAGETPVSKLSQEERNMRVKLIKPTSADGPVLSGSAAPLTLSASLDWRSYNGNSYVTPVRNQGNCGSCWAFATTASLESSTNIKNNTPGYDLNLAEQILVSCSGAGSCNGGSIGAASNFIQSTGLPNESAYPYTATNGTCSNAAPGWQLSDYRINSWSYVATSSPTVDGIKNALATYGPLVTTMAVYNDFFSYRSGIYAYATGSLAGYHAVQIVGYDDTTQSFTVKNSWGTGWGEAGFFRIAYTELTSPTQFGDYTIAYVNGTPPAPACSYLISPTSASVPASGGSGSVAVTTTDGCTWTATSNTSWISIVSSGSGTGNGTVTYTVPGTVTTRSGSISVAGQTFTVQQKVANPKAGKKK